MPWFHSRARRRLPLGRRARAVRRRPRLEPLELRLVPAVFSVINTGDTGSGTATSGDLRYCITRANATAGRDTIQFALPTTDAGFVDLNHNGQFDPGDHWSIAPTSALPVITDAVLIDGYSQPGSSPNTLAGGDDAVLAVELNGAAAGANVSGLAITGVSNCDISGLAINRFSLAGIFLRGASGNVIEGNFIGTDVTGKAALGNVAGGVLVRFGSSGNAVGGPTPGARNLISGTVKGDGVSLEDLGTNDNLVQGNFIGTDATGLSALGNKGGGEAAGGSGISIYSGASNNHIGGTVPGAGNLISGNNGQGIYLNTSVSDNRIEGNLIGTDVKGETALANTSDGVSLSGPRVEGNVIGGSTPEARNVISGNGRYGIRMLTPGNDIEGNYIGTDASGTKAVANVWGIVLQTFSLTAADQGAIADNVISGNLNGGVDLAGMGYRIEGNFIGTNRDGTVAVANGGAGILLSGKNNTIGGTTAATRNLISGNLGNGVEIDGNTSTGNLVEGNFIGTDVTGTADLGNRLNGVAINAAPDNTIGGG